MAGSERFNRAWSGGGTANGTNKSSKGEELYEKLRTYEARRRLAYSSKLDSVSLYWKSYRDLLSASMRETGRAHRIVLGTSHAYAMYAEAMKGIYEDTFLDSKGNVVTDRQKRKKAQARKKGSGDKELDVGQAKVSVLQEVRGAQTELASRFQESSKNMDEEIAELIGSLLDTTKESFGSMERLGSSIVAELEKTEKEVTAAWNNYLNSKSVGESKNDASNPKTAADPWVVEMQYRVAVTYQNLAWEKGNEELKKLYVKVKQEEIDRRMNLREFLVAFAQRQQRLFLSLPEIQTNVLEELAGKEMTREEMSKIVHNSIEEHAEKYKQSVAMKNVDDDLSDLNLESPLTSDLLSKSKVVLRQGQGGDWTLSLAVMSADSFLHLFDIESTKVKLTTSPEIALAMLAPPLIPTDMDHINMGKSNFGKTWSDSLTPSVSMVLAQCRIKQIDDNSFEILETLSASTSKKFSRGKNKRRRIHIQTPTKEETDDWIQILTA